MQVVDVLNAHRQAHHVFAHAGLGEFLGVELAVRGRCRVRGQRFGIANIDQAGEQLQRIQKAGTGGAAFAIVPPVQMRVMEAASEAPGLASSINVGAFNLGNALGAAVGAAVISLNLGYAAVPVAGGLLAAVGLGLVLLAARRP